MRNCAKSWESVLKQSTNKLREGSRGEGVCVCREVSLRTACCFQKNTNQKIVDMEYFSEHSTKKQEMANFQNNEIYQNNIIKNI